MSLLSRGASSRVCRALGLGAMIAVATACGWQLRGSGQGDIEGEPLIVASELGEGAVVQLTRQSLRRLGARVVEAGDAAPTLRLTSENTSRRTIATDDDGRASAWELAYRLSFSLRPASDASSDGEQTPPPPLLRERTVRASQTYDAAPQDALAEEAQRERLIEELREEAVRLMISQVATAL